MPLSTWPVAPVLSSFAIDSSEASETSLALG